MTVISTYNYILAWHSWKDLGTFSSKGEKV
jgi:hypothetical protein